MDEEEHPHCREHHPILGSSSLSKKRELAENLCILTVDVSVTSCFKPSPPGWDPEASPLSWFCQVFSHNNQKLYAPWTQLWETGRATIMEGDMFQVCPLQLGDPGMLWLSPRLTDGEPKDAGTKVSKVNTEGHEKMGDPGQEKKFVLRVGPLYSISWFK